MPPDSEEHAPPTHEHFIPRKQEMEQLARLLPTKGVNTDSNRVFNIWGEDGVGKSTFISSFRESSLMAREKVLWLQPTREGELDTVPEFIAACAKTIRYPADPKKEKKIAALLEGAQRGKVNPIVSDDSILITRSSVAKNKKRYVNEAAAASVGRTETVRDDIQINVGLGESKSTNHAEGFLDALPLQSLGTALTIIYIESFAKLSVAIVDWLRDYVFPTATRGPYRRSLVFLFESIDPIQLAYPNETWGDWSHLTKDYRLYPLHDDDLKTLCENRGLSLPDTHFVKYRSLGYPQETTHAITTRLKLDLKSASAFLDSLATADQIKVAALSLLDRLYPDELDAIFGLNAGKPLFTWFAELPNNPATFSPSSKSMALPDSLRAEAIRRYYRNDAFRAFAKKANPLAKVLHNVSTKTERARLLLLSGLEWIDSHLCEQLFGEQAEKIIPFLAESHSLFTRHQDRYRISDRFRDPLREVAIALQHPGVTVVAKKAKKLWDEKAAEIGTEIRELESKIDVLGAEISALTKKHNETTAQIRIQNRETEDVEPHEEATFAKWLHLSKSAKDQDPTQGLRHLNNEISAKIHEHERDLDARRSELASAKRTLAFPYV